MNEKMQQVMEQSGVEFGEIADCLGINKRTLTRKFKGEVDWTFNEMMILSTKLKIEDPEKFFFN